MQSWKARFDGEGDEIITGGDQGKLTSYSVESGEKTSDSRIGDHFLSALAVSPMGSLAIGNTNGDLTLRFPDGEETLFLTEHNKKIRAIKFSSDGSKVLLASDDLRISVFDLYISAR